MERAADGGAANGPAPTRTTPTSPTRPIGSSASSRSRSRTASCSGSSCRTSASTAPRRAASTPAPPAPSTAPSSAPSTSTRTSATAAGTASARARSASSRFNHDTGRANKCTFCNDRIHNGLGPACAKTCPTESIQFGFRDELVAKAQKRVAKLKEMGVQGRPALRGGRQGSSRRAERVLPPAGPKPSTYDLPEKPLAPAAQRPGRLAPVGGLGAARRRGRAPGLPRAGRQGGRRCLRRPTGRC